MCKTKLVPALVAAIAVMTPAAAAAAPSHARTNAHGSALGACLVSLVAQPYQIASGEAAQLFGRVRCAGNGGVGQTVTVYEQAAGSGAYTTLGTTTAGADGFYSIVAPKLTSDTLFYASAASTRSAAKARAPALSGAEATIGVPASAAARMSSSSGISPRNSACSTIQSPAWMAIERF